MRLYGFVVLELKLKGLEPEFRFRGFSGSEGFWGAGYNLKCKGSCDVLVA